MNKREASKFLGVSERAINRYVSAGKLSVSYRKLETGSKEAVYDLAEVKRLKKAFDAPQPIIKREPSRALTVRENVTFQKAGDIQTALLQIAESSINTRGDSLIAVKLTLTLREAAKLSGLSRGYLLLAIKKKKLKAAKRGRGWNIKRSDLELWVSKL